MTYISNFEHGIRGIQTIHLLNQYKNWLNGRQGVLDDDKLNTLKRSLSAAHGNAHSSDLVGYYFKDSGAIDSSITIQIGKIIRKILDKDDVERFVQISNNFLLNNEISGDDKQFIVTTLESAIESIDYLTRKRTEVKSNFESDDF